MAAKKSMMGMMDKVPGLDFVQNLLKSAPSALPPSLTQWIAPTLSVEELDKKITDLKAVQMWLESQAKMVQATTQALEVQRMTLATLKTMKVNMGDVAASLTGKGKDAGETAGDPTQWWNALSKNMAQPFMQMASQVASNAMQASTKATAKAMQDVAMSTAKTAVQGTTKRALKTASAMADVATAMMPKLPTAPAKRSAAKKLATKKPATKKLPR
jgi:ribosomal protein L29